MRNQIKGVAKAARGLRRVVLAASDAPRARSLHAVRWPRRAVTSLVPALLVASLIAGCGETGAPSSRRGNVSPTEPNPTQPTDPTEPTGPFVPPNLTSADFDDGSFDALFDETSGNSVIADPTGSGRGFVYRTVYQGTNGTNLDSRADLNRFVSYNPTSGLSHGSTVFFRGDVYFPANTPNFTNGNVLRKLTYWRTDRSLNQQVDFVLLMWGNRLAVSVARPGHEDHKNNVFAFNAGQWYQLEIQATMNSRPGSSDGIVRVWVNGAKVYEKLDESFTQASDPASTRWNWLTVGHQREGAFDDTGAPIESSIDEERYWDRVAFSTSRIGPN